MSFIKQAEQRNVQIVNECQKSGNALGQLQIRLNQVLDEYERLR
jgi:hypothetical protein